MGVTYKKPKAKVEKEKSILIYSDFGCTTGFANVMKELVTNWSKFADKNTKFYIFALNCFAEESYNFLPNVVVVPANKMPLAIEGDTFQYLAFEDIVLKCDFDIIYFLNDIEIVGKISGDLNLMNFDRKQKKRKQFKTIFYFPVDSLPRKENLSFLSGFSEIVTFTQYAKNIIYQLAPSNVSEKIQVLPHGVNTSDFYKLPTQEVIDHKIKMFGADRYVFGTVNRNSSRKDIATIILAFAEFIENFNNATYLKEKFCLYLHCNSDDPFGVNLKYLAMTLGLVEGKNIFFPKDFSENAGVEVADLNMVYNMMDCFITTSTAEGWGLTLTEAMAAETMTIAPMHTSFVEITEGGQNTIALHSLEPIVFVGDGTKVRYKTTVKELVQRMHIANSINMDYNSEKVPFIEAAHKYVQKYSWEETAKSFWKLMQKYLK